MFHMYPILYDSAYETRCQLEYFRDLFRSRYEIIPEVPVTRRLDPTVRFIGSPTNVVKSHILGNFIPAGGLAVAQTFLRTQNLLASVTAHQSPGRCSVIPMVGLAARASGASEMARDVAAYFLSLPFGLAEHMVVWVSGSDPDLLDLCRQDLAPFLIQVDAQPLKSHRHVYGVEGLYGRNLNFGVSTASGRTDQIGNLVVIEWEGQPRAVEFGISLPMLLSLCHDKPHPICATPVAEVLRPGTPTDIWLADALATAHLLITAGLRPRHHGRNRTVRTALWRAAELLEPSSFELPDIARALDHLSSLEAGPASAGLPERITRYIELSTSKFTGRTTGTADLGAQLSRIL